MRTHRVVSNVSPLLLHSAVEVCTFLNLSLCQSAVFMKDPHMHPQHCAVLGPQSVDIFGCSSLVTGLVLDIC